MSQTVGVTAALGAAKTGLAIGYRVLNLDRTTYSAFTTTGVAESPAGSGTYHVSGGVVAPDAGGYVVVGVSGTDHAESPIDPAPPTVAAIQSGLATSSALTTVDTNVDAIKAKTDNLPADPAGQSAVQAAITAAINNAASNITVISAVNGSTVSVYQSDTWRFSIINSALALDDYGIVALVVKRGEGETDNDAKLYLRTDSGLVRIAGAAPVSAGNGTLTVDNATTLSALVDIDETDVSSGRYTWWIKAFDSADVDGITLATGSFVVKPHGLQATA